MLLSSFYTNCLLKHEIQKSNFLFALVGLAHSLNILISSQLYTVRRRSVLSPTTHAQRPHYLYSSPASLLIKALLNKVKQLIIILYL
jgi:hypothetical protein